MPGDANTTDAVALSHLYEGAMFHLEGSDDVYQWVGFDPEGKKFLVHNVTKHEDKLLDGTTATFMTQ